MLSWLTLDYWTKINHPEVWDVIVGSLLTGFFTLISAAVAAFFAYRFALRHSRILHNTAIKTDRLRREIDALEKIWGLLAYIAPNENEKNIIRWRKYPDKEKVYFFHYGNLSRYLQTEISQVIYGECGGLYMPAKIKDPFFKIKSSLMGIYIRYEDDKNINEDSLLPIENPELIKLLTTSYQDLNEMIKAELEQRYNHLTY